MSGVPADRLLRDVSATEPARLAERYREDDRSVRWTQPRRGCAPETASGGREAACGSRVLVDAGATRAPVASWRTRPSIRGAAPPSPAAIAPTATATSDAAAERRAARRLTEWWYYTGHLEAGDGRTYGFEFVVFRAERGDFPVSWAGRVAITDESGGRFAYGQRSEIGPP